MFGIFKLLADESPLFSKASIALATPGLSDKLGDIKLKKPAGDAMTAFAEKSSLQFVLSQGNFFLGFRLIFSLSFLTFFFDYDY